MNNDKLLSTQSRLPTLTTHRLDGKKTFSNLTEYSANIVDKSSKTSSISSKESIMITDPAADRKMKEFLDTELIVPKFSKMPDISKYLNSGKIINKKNVHRSNLVQNYM